jgi:hypothetical protein
MSDKIPGGLAKGMSLSDIAKHHKVPLKSLKAKLEQGIKTELEHTTDASIAREIAMDHLFEDPNYYVKLKKIEEKVVKERTFENDEIAIYDDPRGNAGETRIYKRGTGYYGENDSFDFEAKDKAELEQKLKRWGYTLQAGSIEEKKKPIGLDAYALELQKGLEESLLEAMLQDNMFRSNYIDFDRLERELDFIFDDLGIDINLTKHFKERIIQRKIDKRDIMDLMSKIHDKYSQEVRFLKRDDNRVFRHLTRLLDIASVAGGIDNDGYKDLFLKTILKRQDTSEPPLRTNYTSPVLTVNEGKVNYKNLIPEINKFMAANGMNVEPFPAVKFIEDDEQNADDPLGTTAYYDPANKTIVLYTMKRHPKDILRSYAHEMVHHEQNLNKAIGDGKIKTTNTLEDDYLDKIEREAYEKGNIMFRNWTDSLKK